MAEMTLTNQIEMLRVQLETALPTPAFLVVSSALDGDGKGVVASELARSMEAAGYSTLLVLAEAQPRTVDGGFHPRSLDEVIALGISRYLVRTTRASSNVIFLPGDKIRHSVSRESVRRFAQTCRDAYQVTIVEAAAVMTNSFSMLAAVAADGVLLTVREGRRVCGQDRQLAKALTREEAPFLGVVSVAPSLIPTDSPRPVQHSMPQTKPTITTVKGETNREEQPV
jgi:hypothetical protein